MKLDKLIIEVNGKQKRVVEFHDGLNLVTNKPGSGRTGNSIGKSTLSRVVDFLFLGPIGSIYIDEEFKQPNREIETLFLDNEVMASLSFIDSLGKSHQIARNFSIDETPQVFIVDGEKLEEKKYESILQELCFGIRTRRPSVRSIIPKFIRNDSHRMLSTTKMLDRHASGKDYSELYLYLFGFSDTQLLTDKRDATNLVNRRKRNSRSINAMVKEQNPSSEIKRYKTDAKKLEEDLLKFDYSPEYSNPVARLSELQESENRFTDALLSVERKIDNINTTIHLLSRDSDGYLVKEIKSIYNYAGVSVEGALRDLEDVLLFHNNLVDKKKQFLTKDMPQLNDEKEELLAELSEIRDKKMAVFSDMRSTESISNITSNLKALGDLKVSLGKLEGLLEQQKKAKVNLTEAELRLSRVLEAISNEIENVYLFESYFNAHFKKITKRLHDEEYEIDISFNGESGACDIAISNTATNPEGGKKKAEVIAFDMAYIHAVKDSGINRPLFVFHDSIEDIDRNQIEDIFEQAIELPGQQILSMLSDKIKPETYNKISRYSVLLLEENDKFFRV